MICTQETSITGMMNSGVSNKQRTSCVYNGRGVERQFAQNMESTMKSTSMCPSLLFEARELQIATHHNKEPTPTVRGATSEVLESANDETGVDVREGDKKQHRHRPVHGDAVDELFLFHDAGAKQPT